MLQNNNKVAGQVIPHVHFHIIPREERDGQNVVYLHDQEQYSEYVVGIPVETFAIVRFFNGKHSPIEIQQQ